MECWFVFVLDQSWPYRNTEYRFPIWLMLSKGVGLPPSVTAIPGLPMDIFIAYILPFLNMPSNMRMPLHCRTHITCVISWLVHEVCQRVVAFVFSGWSPARFNT